MAGHLNVPMNVAALHDLGVSYVVGPRQHFDRLPRDALISESSRARLILSCFRRDTSVMARLRILLANDPTCGIACNRINDHSVVERVAQLVEREPSASPRSDQSRNSRSPASTTRWGRFIPPTSRPGRQPVGHH